MPKASENGYRGRAAVFVWLGSPGRGPGLQHEMHENCCVGRVSDAAQPCSKILRATCIAAAVCAQITPLQAALPGLTTRDEKRCVTTLWHLK